MKSLKPRGRLAISLNHESQLEAGLVLYATGRQANTAGLELETTNLVMHSSIPSAPVGHNDLIV